MATYCERCGKPTFDHTERFCEECASDAWNEMEQSGYLEPGRKWRYFTKERNTVMAPATTTPNPRVVEIAELHDGTVARTVYAIYDGEFALWMSEEPYEELIWTQSPRERLEFSSRNEAEEELEKFLEWGREEERRGVA